MTRYNGLLGWFWVRIRAGHGALILVCRLALKERQYSAVMAATGLMYLAILTGFGQDIVARVPLAVNRSASMRRAADDTTTFRHADHRNHLTEPRPEPPGSGETTSLDGTWKAIPDPYDVGGFSLLGPARDGWFRDRKPQHPGERIEYDFDGSLDLEVPGDWNTQIPELHYYEASLWYRRRFTTTEEESGRTFVHFGAVNHSCTIYLDGDVLARTRAATARSPSRSPDAWA